MWRRCITAKFALAAVSRSFRSIQNSTVVTLSNYSRPGVSYQNVRFLSLANQSEIEQHQSPGWAQDGDDNSEADPFGSFFQDDDNQLDNPALPENGAQNFYVPNQPTGAQVEREEENSGVQYSYVPYQPTDTQVERVEEEEEDKEETEQGTAYEVNAQKLENVLSLLQSSVDGSLESSLDRLGLDLHEELVLTVLETPHVSGESLIRFFKWALDNKGEILTTPVVDALVRAICSDLRRKDAYGLWDLVRNIGEEGKVEMNVKSLNSLIALFSKLGKGKAALEVFDKLADMRCFPDSDTYYYTIEALCRRSFYDWGWSVCEKMLDAGSLPDSEKIGKIISWFCKGSHARDAHAIYMLAKEKNKLPPQSAVNFLIGSLCQKDENIKLAVELLDDFSGEARKYAIKPFSSVIRGLCRSKDADGAKVLLSKMIAEDPPPGNAVFNLVINSYCKNGDMRQAMEVLGLMEGRGLKPDVYTYTVIMSGYVTGGQMEDACSILSEAKKKHSKLSPVTYHTLIRGYCKLEQFDKALELLAEMEEFGVQPKPDEYNKLIQSLCLKALDWGTAEKLLEEMKKKGLHLNGITRGLIRAVKELEDEALGRRVSIEV